MPIDLNPVRPGDLITSDFMNRLLTHINNLEQRIANLEDDIDSGSSVRITGFDPPTEQSVGQLLTIEGENFAFPTAGNQVMIDDQEVTSFEASSETRIRFVVPQLSNLPRSVRISVQKNGEQPEVRLYRITPEVPVAGDPPVIDQIVALDGSGTLSVGEPFVIEGSNFASNPADNRITIEVANSSEPRTWEITTINEQASTTDRIEATLPDDIPIRPITGDQSLDLFLTVGAHPPATGNFIVVP